MSKGPTDRGALPSRRAFLAGAGAAAATLASGGAAAAPSRGEASLELGIASYSLRRFDRAAALSAVRALGCRRVSLKSMHLPYDSSPEEIARARAELAVAGLKLVGGGVVYMLEDDESEIRGYFEYARACGMPLLAIGPSRSSLTTIEKCVREYDIAVAIHNHGPEDEHFPSPLDALEAVAGRDPRVGICLDVGHAARAGVDVPAAVAEVGERLLDVHFKDLRDLRVRESQCIVGEGAMPTAAILRALLGIGYGGTVNLEYEIDPDDPLPGMHRSLAFLRGALAGLTA